MEMTILNTIRDLISKKGTIAIVLIVTVFVVCVAAYLIAYAYQLDGLIYLPRIQAALDEQCGVDVASVNFAGYHNDPAPSWSENGISCYRGIDRFICSCR